MIEDPEDLLGCVDRERTYLTSGCLDERGPRDSPDMPEGWWEQNYGGGRERGGGGGGGAETASRGGSTAGRGIGTRSGEREAGGTENSLLLSPDSPQSPQGGGPVADGGSEPKP